MVTPITRLMTENIVSVPAGTNLYEAHQLMKQKRLRHLPVIDIDERVIGIISNRDIHLVEKSKNLSVEMMMSSPVQFVELNTTLRNTILLMLEKKISSAPDAHTMGIFADAVDISSALPLQLENYTGVLIGTLIYMGRSDSSLIKQVSKNKNFKPV